MAVGYDHVNLANLLSEGRVRRRGKRIPRSAENLCGDVAAGPPVRGVRANRARARARGARPARRGSNRGHPRTHDLASLGAGRSSADRERQSIEGQILAKRGEDAKAEPLLAASYDKLSTAYGLSDPRTRATANALAALYRRTSRAHLADQIESR